MKARTSDCRTLAKTATLCILIATSGMLAAGLGGCDSESPTRVRHTPAGPPPPTPLVQAGLGGSNLTFWPYVGTTLDCQGSDPVNLIFVGHASPAEIRAALMALDGDRGAMGLPPIELGALNYILGGLLLVVGLSFAWWSILAQLTRGRGTPLPMLPTQELLIQGPFRYCRNPMTLGTIVAYLGIGVAVGTIAGIGLVLCFGAFLVLYLKLLEERELAERFGEAYLRYRREVPFIIPRLPRRK